MFCVWCVYVCWRVDMPQQMCDVSGNGTWVLDAGLQAVQQVLFAAEPSHKPDSFFLKIHLYYLELLVHMQICVWVKQNQLRN